MHQPIRYREYSIFDVSNTSNYFHDQYNGRQSNKRIFKKVTGTSPSSFRGNFEGEWGG
jgi:filamentous hemagglutinin family protein